MPDNLMEYGGFTGYFGGMLAQQAAEASQKKLETDMVNAQLDVKKKQIELINQLGMDAAVRSTVANLSDDPAKASIQLGTAIAPFDPDKASQLLTRGVTMVKDQEETKQKALKNSIDNANASAALLESVVDGESLMRVYQRTVIQGIDTKGAIPALVAEYQRNGNRWTPELAVAIEDAKKVILTKMEQATLEAKNASTRAENARTDYLNTRRTQLLPKELENLQSQIDARKREGDVKAGEVKAEDTKLATDLIQRKYDMESVNPGDLGHDARMVVERAKDILAITPGLSRAQAVSQAFNALDAEGRFQGYAVLPPVAGMQESPLKLPRKGRTASLEDMAENQYYWGEGKWAGKLVVKLPGGKKVEIYEPPEDVEMPDWVKEQVEAAKGATP